MNEKELLWTLIGCDAGLLAIILKHMWDCRDNSRQLSVIIRFMKDKLGYKE